MKFYIASKTKHASKWQILRMFGYVVTSTWIDEAGEGQTLNYSELAERCIRDIEASDFLILYCEQGEFLKGALIEVGAALALKQHVFCIGSCDSISRVFKEHPLWHECETISDAISAAREIVVIPS